MKQAEVYIEQTAICPYCNHHNAGIEWADESSNYKETYLCDECEKEFEYAHPDNQCGHSFQGE